MSRRFIQFGRRWKRAFGMFDRNASIGLRQLTCAMRRDSLGTQVGCLETAMRSAGLVGAVRSMQTCVMHIFAADIKGAIPSTATQNDSMHAWLASEPDERIGYGAAVDRAAQAFSLQPTLTPPHFSGCEE